MTPINRRIGIAIISIAGVLALATLVPRGPQLSPEPIRPEPRSGGGACPSAPDAPDMVRLPEGFCIDTTEVSRGHYAAWLETSPDPATQTGACTGNADFTPACAWPPGGGDQNQPVVCVDWCDAQAFCEASGRRLCGAIGGGAYAFEAYADPAVSEWQAACSSGGLNEYTYGSDLDTAICRGADAEDYTTWGTGDVGGFSGCHSTVAGYTEVFDLSGNVAEWDGACDGDGAEDGCHIRGGSFQHNEHGLRCAMGRDLHWPRTRTLDGVGFRCCAD